MEADPNSEMDPASTKPQMSTLTQPALQSLLTTNLNNVNLERARRTAETETLKHVNMRIPQLRISKIRMTRGVDARRSRRRIEVLVFVRVELVVLELDLSASSWSLNTSTKRHRYP